MNPGGGERINRINSSFLQKKAQINVEGMTRLEDHHFIIPDIIIECGDDHQWKIKPLYENSLANRAFIQYKDHLPSGGDHIEFSITNNGTAWHCMPPDRMQIKQTA